MSKRRAKGDGSVFTRKDGRVVGEWTDATGKTRYMTIEVITFYASGQRVVVRRPKPLPRFSGVVLYRV